MVVKLLKIFTGQKEIQWSRFAASLVCVEIVQRAFGFLRGSVARNVLNAGVVVLLAPCLFKDKNVSLGLFLKSNPLLVGLLAVQVGSQIERVRQKALKELNQIEEKWNFRERSRFNFTCNCERTLLNYVADPTLLEGMFRLTLHDVILKLILPPKRVNPFLIKFIKVGVSTAVYYHYVQKNKYDEGLLPIVRKVFRSFVNAFMKEWFGGLPALVHGYCVRRFDFLINEEALGSP